MLNKYDGAERNGRFFVKIRAAALPRGELYVNDIKMTEADGLYTAEAPLDGYHNTLTLYDAQTRESKKIIVFWLKNSTGHYRLSLDDNIWCLRDAAKYASEYKSIFDNPYFAIYKKVHDLYDTKVQMNIYYQCEGFDLSMMPDKYKSEFKENADWFRFSFHARQNDPDKPYLNTTYEALLSDYDKVVAEIRRFAGQEIQPVTTLHWGESTREGVRALRARGIRCLFGFVGTPGDVGCAYYLDKGLSDHIYGRDFWYDAEEDMIFATINIFINNVELKDIVPYLDVERQNPHRSGNMELLIHEQYFYPHYVAYRPDYAERVLASVKWAADNGYTPAWVEDHLFE